MSQHQLITYDQIRDHFQDRMHIPISAGYVFIQSKARNLLERLRRLPVDLLHFVELESVPYTNNQGEKDLRMTKVQEEISACFRSIDGAKLFCGVRNYLSTCRTLGMMTP